MKLNLTCIILCVLALLVSACQEGAQMEFNRYYSNGSTVYQMRCQNCHGAKGEGLQGLIPPLTDTIYLKNNIDKLACFLNNGLKGRVTIHNKEFEGAMPASGLSPVEIAQVLTYVNNSFGNKLGTFTTEKVNADLSSCN